MTTKTKTYVAVAVFAALLLGACQSYGGNSSKSEMKEITTQNSGDLRISLMSESGDLKQGQNRFRIVFRSADGRPVDAGTVTVSSAMAMPGMAPMVAPIELASAREAGQYALTGSFAMSGAWRFEVRWDGPAGQGRTSFSTNVR